MTIETAPDDKSRSFTVDLIAYVTADDLWELGTTSKDRIARPVLLAYAATSQTIRAFSANLRDGRPAALHPSANVRIEIPKSAGFRFETSSRDRASLTLAYLPAIFSVEHRSSQETDNISFLCLPPIWWVDQEQAAAAAVLGEDGREAVVSTYFASYLDLRSDLPIVNDLGFHLQLYRAALQQDWCNTSPPDNPTASFAHTGLRNLGFETAIHCNVDRSTFAQFLAAQTVQHLSRSKENAYHGPTRFHRPGRILPDPVAPAPPLGVAG